MSPAVSTPCQVQEHALEGFRFESRLTGWDRQGLPIVLVGGAFQRKESWGRLEERLIETVPVVTVDLPGWGAADTLPADVGVDFLPSALQEMLRDRGLTRVKIAAGSYGSAIGYRLAQQRPDLVWRLFLMSTMTRIPESARDQIEHSLSLLDRGDLPAFASTTVSLFMCSDPARRIAHGPVVKRILTTRFTNATPDELEKYRLNTRRLLDQDLLCPQPAQSVPTLVVTGEHDDFTRPELCRQVAETCPDSFFATFRDADHMVHLERTGEVADLGLRFFHDVPLADLDYCAVTERVN
ncbi:alpha/beta fold hydrolase [Streptomyces sp. 4F14]|uniref:alpha/beta fold hydrolase n=1 Tax=Streptomyces sp. 4F14 TaxID=3394380 RepID=UPI003A83DD2D